MNWSNIKHEQVKISVWIQEGLILLGCFLHLIFNVQPVLLIEPQPPIFFLTTQFLKESLLIPGGLADWLAALFMQFWFSSLLTSAFLTLSLWLVMFLTKKWIETLTENRPVHSVQLIPVGLLLAYHSQYDFNFSITVALIINMLALVLFLRWTPKDQTIRSIVGFIVCVMLFWTTGGAFLLFTVLCGIDELLRKRFISGPVVLFISGILPFIASHSIFLVPLKQAYLHNLIVEYPLEIWYLGYILLFFFPSTLVLASLVKYIKHWKPIRKMTKVGHPWKLTIGTILIVSGFVLLGRASTNDIKQYVQKLNRYVYEERWEDVLQLTKNGPYENQLISVQSNLALYQTGKLLDSMFAYSQSNGFLGLLMNHTWSLAWSEETSNIYWKLGLVNESQHFGHEALEHKGPTSNILKRLGMVYMIKGENDAARRFFLNLKNVPFQRNTADHLLRLNENPSELYQDSTCNYVKSCMPIEDLHSWSIVFIPKLELLLKRNPKNKMAFEYLIAFHLLNANGKGIFDHIPDFSALQYAKLPRHVQEAFIVIASMIPKYDMNNLKRWIDIAIFNRFVEYRKVLVNHKQDKNSARQELLARFGDTYWYYLMYIKSGPRQSEGQNDYQ